MNKKSILIILLSILIGIGFLSLFKYVQYNAKRDITLKEEEINNQKEMNKELKVGLRFPDFNFESLDGKNVSIKDYRGKIILLNFWSTTSIFSDKEMTDLEELYNKNKSDFVVLAVNLGESKEVVKEYIKNNGYTFPVLLDVESKTSEKYEIYELPTAFLIDNEGNLLGFIDENGNTVDRIVGMLTREEMFSILSDIKKGIAK